MKVTTKSKGCVGIGPHDLNDLLDEVEAHPLAERAEQLLTTNTNLLEKMHSWALRCQEMDLRISGRLLIELVRADRRFKVTNIKGSPRLNNSYAPILARLLLVTYPDLSGTIELAAIKQEVAE